MIAFFIVIIIFVVFVGLRVGLGDSMPLFLPITVVLMLFVGLGTAIFINQMTVDAKQELEEWNKYVKANGCKVVSTTVADVFYKRDIITYKCNDGSTHARRW